jgi:hypothetical protein
MIVYNPISLQTGLRRIPYVIILLPPAATG